MSESRRPPASRGRLVGRLLVGLCFLLFGVHQLLTASGLGTEPVPPASFWLVVRGVSLLVVSASVWADRLTAILLPAFALLMLVFIVALDLPDALDPEARHFGLIEVVKNLLLAGTALLYSVARRPAEEG